MRVFDCAPKANGRTITVWVLCRIDRQCLIYRRHRGETLLRHRLLSGHLLLLVVKPKPRSHRGMFCRGTSTPQYDTSMTKNSTDWFRLRLKHGLGTKSFLSLKKVNRNDELRPSLCRMGR